MTHAEQERFFLDFAEVEYRDAKGGEPAIIRGYAAVFNRESRDLGGFVETIRPGAFHSFLESGEDVIATIDHDPSKLLGRRGSGTLTLNEDGRGLRMEIRPPETSYARDLSISMRRGDVRGASFGFIVDGRDGQEWRTTNGKRVRELRKLRLLDVAVVSVPAYDDAHASIRHYKAWLADKSASTPTNNGMARARLRIADATLRARHRR